MLETGDDPRPQLVLWSIFCEFYTDFSINQNTRELFNRYIVCVVLNSVPCGETSSIGRQSVNNVH